MLIIQHLESVAKKKSEIASDATNMSVGITRIRRFKNIIKSC